jgi:hypothetical protein
MFSPVFLVHIGHQREGVAASNPQLVAVIGAQNQKKRLTNVAL